jgi:hypothetical protein
MSQHPQASIATDPFNNDPFSQFEPSQPSICVSDTGNPEDILRSEISELSSPTGSGSFVDQYSPSPEPESRSTYSQDTSIRFGRSSDERNSRHISGRNLTSIIHHHGQVNGIGPTRKWKCTYCKFIMFYACLQI